jgi:putative PIN family toxin of toxin-antitoxin system
VSIRVVFDTMIFLQNAARPGRVHRSFQLVRDGSLTLCLSPELLAEVRDVLSRDTIRRRFPALTDGVVDAFLADVLAVGELVSSVPRVFTWPRHPDDDHLFNLAIAAGAAYLVTWETRLLGLRETRHPDAGLLRPLAPDLAIVTPVRLAELVSPGA